MCFFFAGTSSGEIVAGILLAGLAISLITPIPNKPKSVAPSLQPLNLDLLYGHELTESLKLQNLTHKLINAIPKNDNSSQLESTKRWKRSTDCQGSTSALQACYAACFAAFQSSSSSSLADRLIQLKTCLTAALDSFLVSVDISMFQNENFKQR